jgi:hypothetical protein
MMKVYKPPPSSPSRRDFWDKADVVAKFLSSVVIAVIGIAITWSIQRTQIQTNEAIARSQLEASRAKALDDKRLQENQITVQLLNHLVSDNGTQRRLAVVALRQSVPSEVYDSVVQILARSDEDEAVRRTAIQQLRTVQSPQAGTTLLSIATDNRRSASERQLAAESSGEVALKTGAERDTFVFLATQPGQHSMESPQAGGGLFSAALLRAMTQRSGNPLKPFPITARSLSEDLNLHVASLSGGRQTPSFYATGSVDTTFFVPGTESTVRRALVIGSGKTSDPVFSPLQFPEIDAKRLSDRLREFGFEVTTLINPTKAEVSTALKRLQALERTDVLGVFYSGHAAVGTSPAITGWITSDSTRVQSTWVPIEEVKQAISLANAKTKWYFVDADYSAELLRK